MSRLLLVSHTLCPYVQRVAIVLAEKGLPFERRDVDLSDKPAWFLRISPLGRTPVLVVDAEPLFESAAICDFLDEAFEPRLHPADAIARARHRAWMAFASDTLDNIAGFYSAADDDTLQSRARGLRGRFELLESQLGDGPFFAGTGFSVVDAVFAPVFRYFELLDRIGDFGFFAGLPRVARWRDALRERPSVRDAVGSAYQAELLAFIRRKESALARRAASL